MNENNDASNMNTVLIVIVLLLIVGFGVWWFTMRTGVDTTNTTTPGGTNVNVTVPAAPYSAPTTP